MRLDSIVIHSDDMGAVVGKFYDSDIREVDMLAVEMRDIRDAQLSARLALGEGYPNVELLNGEGIQGNIIRRLTTAEVQGDEFYAKEIPGGRQVSLEEAGASGGVGALITWRPNNENFAVIHEEVAE